MKISPKLTSPIGKKNVLGSYIMRQKHGIWQEKALNLQNLKTFSETLHKNLTVKSTKMDEILEELQSVRGLCNVQETELQSIGRMFFNVNEDRKSLAKELARVKAYNDKLELFLSRLENPKSLLAKIHRIQAQFDVVKEKLRTTESSLLTKDDRIAALEKELKLLQQAVNIGHDYQLNTFSSMGTAAATTSPDIGKDTGTATGMDSPEDDKHHIHVQGEDGSLGLMVRELGAKRADTHALSLALAQLSQEINNLKSENHDLRDEIYTLQQRLSVRDEVRLGQVQGHGHVAAGTEASQRHMSVIQQEQEEWDDENSEKEDEYELGIADNHSADNHSFHILSQSHPYKGSHLEPRSHPQSDRIMSNSYHDNNVPEEEATSTTMGIRTTADGDHNNNRNGINNHGDLRRQVQDLKTALKESQQHHETVSHHLRLKNVALEKSARTMIRELKTRYERTLQVQTTHGSGGELQAMRRAMTEAIRERNLATTALRGALDASRLLSQELQKERLAHAHHIRSAPVAVSGPAPPEKIHHNHKYMAERDSHSPVSVPRLAMRSPPRSISMSMQHHNRGREVWSNTMSVPVPATSTVPGLVSGHRRERGGDRDRFSGSQRHGGGSSGIGDGHGQRHGSLSPRRDQDHRTFPVSETLSRSTPVGSTNIAKTLFEKPNFTPMSAIPSRHLNGYNQSPRPALSGEGGGGGMDSEWPTRLTVDDDDMGTGVGAGEGQGLLSGRTPWMESANTSLDHSYLSSSHAHAKGHKPTAEDIGSRNTNPYPPPPTMSSDSDHSPPVTNRVGGEVRQSTPSLFELAGDNFVL